MRVNGPAAREGARVDLTESRGRPAGVSDAGIGEDPLADDAVSALGRPSVFRSEVSTRASPTMSGWALSGLAPRPGSRAPPSSGWALRTRAPPRKLRQAGTVPPPPGRFQPPRRLVWCW